MKELILINPTSWDLEFDVHIDYSCLVIGAILTQNQIRNLDSLLFMHPNYWIMYKEITQLQIEKF